MNRQLLLSILAMDSYNRGAGQSISGLSTTGRLGNANLIVFPESVRTGWARAGFYATAYSMTGVDGFADGETVISYRGSDRIDKVGAF